MALKVSAQHLAEMQDLVKEGDIDLGDTRATFTDNTGEDCTATASELLAALALQTDDDDEELVSLIRAIQQEGFEIVNEPAAA